MDMQDISMEAEMAYAQLQSTEAQLRHEARVQGIDLPMMRYPDGSMAMAPLIYAKAQLLSVLYDMQKSQLTKRVGEVRISQILEGDSDEKQ